MTDAAGAMGANGSCARVDEHLSAGAESGTNRLTFAASAFSIILPSRAEPSRAEPSRAEPSRAEPSRAEPVTALALWRRLRGPTSPPEPSRRGDPRGASQKSHIPTGAPTGTTSRRAGLAARRPVLARLLPAVLAAGFAAQALAQTPSVTVNRGNAVDEGGNAEFTLTASPAPSANVSVNVDVVDSGAFAASGQAGKRTVTIGTTGTATLSVGTVADGTDETNGTITATVQTGTGYSVGSPSAAVTGVYDDDGACQAGFDYYHDDWTITENGERKTRTEWAFLEGREQPSIPVRLTGNCSGIGTTVYYVNGTSETETVNAVPVEIVPYVDGSQTLWNFDAATATYAGHNAGTGDEVIGWAEVDPADGDNVIVARIRDGNIYEDEQLIDGKLGLGHNHNRFGSQALPLSANWHHTGPQAGVTVDTDRDDIVIRIVDDDIQSVLRITDDGIQMQRRFASSPVRAFYLYDGNVVGDFVMRWNDADFHPTGGPELIRIRGYALAVGEPKSGRFYRGGIECVVAIPANAESPRDDAHIRAAINSATRCNRNSQIQYFSTGFPAPAMTEPVNTPRVSVSTNALSVTEGDDATFTITADPAPNADLTVHLDVAEHHGDPGGLGPSLASHHALTVPAGRSSATYTYATTEVADHDGGVLRVTVLGDDAYTQGASSAQVELVDAPAVSGSGDGCVEALAGDGAVTGTWTADCDSRGRAGRYARYYTFTMTEAGRVTIDLESATDAYLFLRRGADHETGRTVRSDDDGGVGRNARISASLEAGDYSIEATTYSSGATGDFTLTVSGLPAQGSAPTTPEIGIAGGADVTEGGDAVFTVTADPAPAADLAVNIGVSQSGEFGVSTGSRTVTVGTSGTATLTVATAGDDADEPDGSVTATLGAGDGYTIASSANAATVSVADDDDPPDAFVPDPALVAEVTEKADNHANPDAAARLRRIVQGMKGEDGGYTAAECRQAAADHGVSATWKPWCDEIERRENWAGAAPTPTPTPTPTPEVSVGGGAGITEGGSAVFTLTASPAPASALSVNVTVSQSGDFGAATGSRTVTITTSGTATLSIATTDDTVDEPDGSVTATLGTGSSYTVSSSAGAATVAVADDDDPPAPEISIAGGSGVTEGGTAVFTLTASPAPASALTVSVSVSQSGDYGAATGTRTVTISTSGTATLSVATAGDNVDEPDGSVTATLGTGSGYTVSSSAGAATVTVADDDAPTPEVGIAGGSDITEGGNAVFTLTASPAPASALTVSVSVSQSGDYGVSTGSRTVTVPTGGTATLSVATAGDDADEPDGSVTATLGTGSGYTVSAARNSATVAVADDDDAPPPARQCVSESLHERVRGYHANPPSEAAKARWAAVLQAFGDDMGVTAMTADEAQAYHDRGPTWREKWAGVPEAIRCLENQAVSANVNGPVVTLRWASPRDGFGSPSGTDYGVRVNGLARAVVSAELSGDTAWLVLAAPVAAGDDVTVAYLGSAMHPLADASGRVRSGPWNGLVAENLTGIERLRAPAAMIVDARPADPLAAADSDAVMLDASGLGLTDLRGAARLTALERLDLSDNALSDLSSLAGLGSLRDLDLSGNRITDLWPLSGLYGLERLNLSDNAATDVRALAGLPNLEVLLLDGNAVGDVWPLAGLQRLENLGLAGNRIGDVTALQDLARLRRLDLSGNPAGDLSPLGDIGSLVWVALPGAGLGASETLGRLNRLGWVWLGSVELSPADTQEEAAAPR